MEPSLKILFKNYLETMDKYIFSNIFPHNYKFYKAIPDNFTYHQANNVSGFWFKKIALTLLPEELRVLAPMFPCIHIWKSL